MTRPNTGGTELPTVRSWRAAAPMTKAATVRKPAAVCAARSRATSRRPYQKPGLLSAGGTGRADSGSSALSGAPGPWASSMPSGSQASASVASSGLWDS
ncbi:hypothetical protein SBADM41S_06600 [Streptomyces badius]